MAIGDDALAAGYALVPSSGPTTFGFDEEIMQISEDAPNSMNLLIIARKSM